MTIVGVYYRKYEEQRPHPKKNNNYESDGKIFVHHGDTKRKTEVAKKGSCCICGGPRGYARCPELKSLGAVL